ncbi:AtzE family amidohydrolase [Acetobacteraceae bacterium H6797]|nr:AtzE family amidohydrolase [Acetobacteraceae bacterium H6797]
MDSMTDLPLDALGIATAIRNRQTTALAVTEAALARIAALDPSLNAFTAVTAERARAEAAAIDAALARGENPGLLAGVPFAVKNLFDLEGLPTLAGSKIEREAAPATADAFLVRKLSAAGAVCLGALNMDEYAYGFTTENAHDGPAHNPHDLTRVAGGSSGGSTAAVAAGLVPLSLGSDTNGSIRVPAALCGIWGLKPTYGRLSRRGSYPFVAAFDHLGPFARTLPDLAVAYDLLQGDDPEDPAQQQRLFEPTTPALTQSIAGMRVKIGGGHFARSAKPEAYAAVAKVAETLGATETVEFKLAAIGRAAAFLITMAEGGNLHLPDLKTRPNDFDPGTRDRFLAGTLLPATWIVQAQRARAAWQAEALAAFQEMDVLITPCLPCTAPLIGQETMEMDGVTVPVRPHLGIFTQPISCIGLPAMAVPLKDYRSVGATMPISVQIVAKPWNEAALFRVAKALVDAGIAGAPELP